MADKMRATIFLEPGRIVLGEKPIPAVGPLDALIRITTTTICGTDIHILKGEYPVAAGLTIGHEGRHHREARVRGHRLPGRAAGDCRRDHPLRLVERVA